GRARLQAGAHPLAFGLAHVAKPAVLQGRQRAKQRDERDERDGDDHQPGHAAHQYLSLYAKNGHTTARFTFLTKRLPRDNNSGAAPSSYSIKSRVERRQSRDDSHETRFTRKVMPMLRFLASVISFLVAFASFVAQ